MNINILYMEPERVREIAGLLQTFAELLLREANSISNAAGGLGGASNNLSGIYGSVSGLNEAAYELIELGVILEEEVQEWETADLEGASNLNGLGYIPSIYVVPTPTPPNTGGPSTPAPSTPHVPVLPVPTPSTSPSQPQTGGSTPQLSDPIPPPVASPSAQSNAGTASPTEVIAGTAGAAGGAATKSYFDSPYWQDRVEELERLDNEIAELEGRGDLTSEESARLDELREQRNRLQQTLDEGIFSQGLSPDRNPFLEGECTWYATSRRNMYPAVWGDAKNWAYQATASGYEVGEMPVKGSIMVWQPGVRKASAAYGHVSFVENVEKLSDGTFRVYYTDNKNMDPSSPKSIIMRLGEAGIDFIYGQGG
jgi:hypothetical protein